MEKYLEIKNANKDSILFFRFAEKRYTNKKKICPYLTNPKKGYTIKIQRQDLKRLCRRITVIK